MDAVWRVDTPISFSLLLCYIGHPYQRWKSVVVALTPRYRGVVWVSFEVTALPCVRSFASLVTRLASFAFPSFTSDFLVW